VLDSNAYRANVELRVSGTRPQRKKYNQQLTRDKYQLENQGATSERRRQMKILQRERQARICLTEALDVSAETTWFEVAPGLTGERHVLRLPKFFLAPHLPTGASRFSVSDDLLNMVRSGKKQIAVQWTANYRDKFGGDGDPGSRHETRQGWILSRVDDDPGRIKINDPIKVTWDAQPDFACVDRGCKDAKQ
jgi:hypothetical protein